MEPNNSGSQPTSAASAKRAGEVPPSSDQGSQRTSRADRKARKSAGVMPLRAHLIELRNRLLMSLVFIAIGVVAGWFLYDLVFDALVAPLRSHADQTDRNIEINFSTVTGAFDFKLKISFYVGLILSSPFWLYQIGAFIMPGLKTNEKRYVWGFTAAAIPMFLGGCAAAFVCLPVLVALFLAITPDSAANIIQAQDYLSFTIQIILALGFACLVPLIVVALNFVGILSAKQILRGWRWIVILCFLFGALVTPTGEVISMFLLALPLLLLFAIAIGIAWVNDARRARRRLARDAELGI